jgi:hypothetical protein
MEELMSSLSFNVEKELIGESGGKNSNIQAEGKTCPHTFRWEDTASSKN